VFRKEECISCGLCAETCSVGAIIMDGGFPIIDRRKCTNCGECVAVCPTGVCEAGERGVKVWAGGRIGRYPKLGEVAIGFLPLEKIPAVIEASLEFFREHGQPKQRFGKVIERIGWDRFKEVIARATE